MLRRVFLAWLILGGFGLGCVSSHGPFKKRCLEKSSDSDSDSDSDRDGSTDADSFTAPKKQSRVVWLSDPNEEAAYPSSLLPQDTAALYRKWEKKPPHQCHVRPRKYGDRRRNPSRLRVASFNAEWLFLYGGAGFSKCPGDGCPWPDWTAAMEHFVRVADLIAKVDADVMHLNEVEDCRVLGLLMDLLPEGHGYRGYLIGGDDVQTGQNVALLTRVDPRADLHRSDAKITYPIPGSRCFSQHGQSKPDKQKGMQRKTKSRTAGAAGLSKHYVAHFRLPFSKGDGALRLVLGGAHLLARPQSHNRCLKREAQATVLAQSIDAVISELPGGDVDKEELAIMVTGDFNDVDPVVPGPDRQRALSKTLAVLKAIDSEGLLSAAQFIKDPFLRYTNWHDINGNCEDDGPEEHALIDHLLMSTNMRERLVRVWIANGGGSSGETNCANRTSDHWPIVADFAL